MQLNWRVLCGPSVVVAATLVTALAERYLLVGPDLSPLFVGIIAVTTSFSGVRAGLISAALAVGVSVPLLQLIGPTDRDAATAADLILFAIAAFGSAVVTGWLQRRRLSRLAQERAHHLTAERLTEALDQIDIGIVLLDKDTRADFINRAFRTHFSLPDAKADSRPPLIALMYHGRDTRAYEMPEDELNAFVAHRTELIRAGDTMPIQIKLANGQVLRMRCAALRDGGRMLSYTPVTDIIRSTDDPAMKERYLSLRGGVGFDRSQQPLRAAE